VFAHGIGWQAIAQAAGVMAQKSGPTLLAKVEATSKSISWGKTNDAWQKVCMVGDRMNKGLGIRSTAGYILAQAEVPEAGKAKAFIEQYGRDTGKLADVKAA
jgi:DNA sulfur modification protein DndB